MRRTSLSAAPSSGWPSLRLARLQRLLLNLVLLRHLLSLLRMPLLYLLRLGRACVRTMFRFLLLLKLLPLLGLLGDQLILVLLVLLVSLRISRVDRRGTVDSGQVIGMNYGAGRDCLLRRWRLVIVVTYRHCLCCCGRLAVIHRGPRSRVGSRGLRTLGLSSYRRKMPLPSHCILL
jgi:hypothetical protein